MDRLGLAYGFTDRSDGSRPLLRGSYALDQNRRSLVELRHVDRRKTGVLELQTQNSRVAEPAR